MPEPTVAIAIVAKSRADEGALAKNLSRLIAGDPDLRLERGTDTHQLCCGAWARRTPDVVPRPAALRRCPSWTPRRCGWRSGRRFAGRPRDTGGREAVGGHGQYAVCDIGVEPLPQGAWLRVRRPGVGGAVPRNYIQSVEKGVQLQLLKGLTTGTRSSTCGSPRRRESHSVDSSDAAFQTAGALALKDAGRARPDLVLEPVTR